MNNSLESIDAIDTLCIMGRGRDEEVLLTYLKKRGVEYRCISNSKEAIEALGDHNWDLIFIDADLDDGNIPILFRNYRDSGTNAPIVAIYGGSWGSRQAALLRMGAFDAFPKDIARWNAEVYIDRAIFQASIAKKLLALSRTDHVTGLYNRHYLRESLKQEMRRSARTDKPLTIALLDIDNFKKFNDVNGHVAGDRALGRVADILLRSIRKGMDSAFRYGGDEFLIILPETDLDQGKVSTNRVLERLERECPFPVSFSVGLSLLDMDADMEAFIHSADKAMYTAKQAGGNRIVTTIGREGPRQEFMRF